MNKKLTLIIILIAIAVLAAGFYVSQADASTCPTSTGSAQQQGTDLDWKTFHFWTSNQFTYDLLKGLGFNIELRKDALAPNSTQQPHDPQSTGLTAEEQTMFDLVNRERVANGLDPLEIDMGLVETARLKSIDMIKLRMYRVLCKWLNLPLGG